MKRVIALLLPTRQFVIRMTRCLTGAVVATAWMSVSAADPPGDANAYFLKFREKVRAEWADVKMIEEKYAAPPGDWHHAIDLTVPSDVSFPCSPQRNEASESGVTLLIYSCRAGKRQYAVLLSRDTAEKTSDAEYQDNFITGRRIALQRASLQRGAVTVFTPLARVNYEGLSGRQEMRKSERETISRVLFVPKGSISMSVTDDEPANFPGDASTFFNSLKMP